jgi:hypothetical protein
MMFLMYWAVVSQVMLPFPFCAIVPAIICSPFRGDE